MSVVWAGLLNVLLGACNDLFPATDFAVNDRVYFVLPRRSLSPRKHYASIRCQAIERAILRGGWGQEKYIFFSDFPILKPIYECGGKSL